MKTTSTLLIMLLSSFFTPGTHAQSFETDKFETSGGPLSITFIGHATLMFQWKGLVIHVDPVSREANYRKLPDADLVLITHEHGDHLDPAALGEIVTDKTMIILTQKCYEKYPHGRVLANGDETEFKGIHIKAVPAYNLVHHRPGGAPFHPKGDGNGYLLSFGDKTVYVAGDTENIPEMKNLKNIDIAFLPMNLPYTMTPEMVADAAKSFHPTILYPYHYGNTDTKKIVSLLSNEKGIEVRIRKMK